MQHELKIASYYLFLDMAIKVLEIDRQNIINGNFKIKPPYLKLINELTSNAIKKRKELKQTMYRQKIKVNFLYREGEFSYYKFIFHRSETVRSYFNPVIKKNVEKIIHELIDEL
ncbi:MAG TPA: hypothetical protein VK085_13475 [Pseudogracilibacillus sp.]|nr:hypothetical protein [Pseudogracilibacillus sp.]